MLETHVDVRNWIFSEFEASSGHHFDSYFGMVSIQAIKIRPTVRERKAVRRCDSALHPPQNSAPFQIALMRFVVFVVNVADRFATDIFSVARVPNQPGNLHAAGLRRLIANDDAGFYSLGHGFYSCFSTAAVAAANASAVSAAFRWAVHFRWFCIV